MANGKILLIAAEEAKRNFLEDGLCQGGYEVRPAGSGSEGLRRLREETPEVVLLDAELPDMDALEVCRRIKADPRTGRTPLIITDHFTDSGERIRYLEGGADACLVQPFESGELLAQVSACVRAVRAEEELRASKERLQFILSSITDAYFAVDRNWQILDVNPVAERLIFHTSKQDLVGKNLWSICPQGEDSQFFREYNKAFAEGRPVHFESQGCLGDLWFEIHACPQGERLDVYGREITERKRQEAMLKVTQFTVDRAAEAIFWIDVDARFVYVNDAACESLGYTRQELTGMTVFDIDPVFARERWNEQWPKLREVGKMQFETVHRSKPGEEFPVEIQANYVLCEGREYHCVFVRDIRERKAAEQALRQSEERFRSLAENLKDVVWILSPDFQRVLYVNEAYRKVWGHAPEQIYQDPQDWMSPILPEDRPPVEEAFRNFYYHRECEMEYRIHRPDGQEQWIRDRAFPVRAADGTLICYAGIAENITERKRADAQLRREVQRSKLLSDCAAYLLSTEEPSRIVSGLYERVADSLQADAVLEYELEEPNGKLRLKTCIGIDEETKERIAWVESGEGLCGCVAMGGAPMIVNHLEQNEEPKAQLLRTLGFKAYICQPLLRGNKVTGTLAFASRRRPVLEEMDREFFEAISRYVALGKERATLLEQLRRHAEHLGELVTERTAKLKELVADLEHFSYAITHDLRAPLRAMGGFSEILLRNWTPQLDARAQDYLRRIHGSAQKMDALITDALAYSRAVREHYPLEPVDAAKLVRGMVESLAHLGASQVEIVEPIPAVLANKPGLTQCVSNLLSNAVKFVQPGRAPQVRIWGEPRGNFVRLWFEDNGMGIPHEYQARIFDMFQRLHEEYEGTGIGLALVRKLTERMGGRVGVESQEGRGSRFWLELRRAQD